MIKNVISGFFFHLACIGMVRSGGEKSEKHVKKYFYRLGNLRDFYKTFKL